MAETPFFGYPGAIWSTCFQAFGFLRSQLASVSDIATTEAVTEATLATTLNGLSAINAFRTAVAWSQGLIGIQSLEEVPVTLSSPDLAVMLNRAAAYAAAAPALTALLPQPPFLLPATALPAGTPCIPDPGLMAFFRDFDYETPPDGTTTDNLVANAAGIVTSFADIAQAVKIYYGPFVTSAYDVADRLSRAASPPASILAQLTSGPLAASDDVEKLWNQIVTLPAMLIDASILSTPPFNLAIQQQSVIRYALLTMANQLALFLLILRSPTARQVVLAQVQNDDTLMDVANRALGDFEEWQAIASLNGLQPPYILPTRTVTTAAWGQQLLLPTAGTGGSATGAVPNYLTNFLGTDLYFGPINGDMPAWGGDYQTISGYGNLRISLGRRLQTTLGTLIYHNDYGSRIPPEVGQIQTSDTVGHIAAFGKSAILSDPRIAGVLNAAAALGPNFSVAFSAVAQPAGPGTVPISINEVLSPNPR